MKSEGLFLIAALLGLTLLMSHPANPSVTSEAPLPPEMGTIQGTVFKQSTGAPLSGADVLLLETDEHQTSAEDGTFWFTEVAPGTYTLSVAHPTYSTEKDTVIEVRAGDTTQVKIYLGELYELEKVIVEGERVPPTVSRQEIRGSELLRLPGTGGDALKGLMTLPSIGIPNDFFGSLYIRGSAPGDNLIYFDRTPMGYPFHYGGIVSTISSEIIEDIHIYAGGYGAEFGLDAQTVIDIHSRDRLEDEALSGTFNLNILYSEGLVEGNVGEKGYVYLAGRRSYLDLVVGLFTDEIPLPYFSDYQFKFAYEVAENHHLMLNAFAAGDYIDIDGLGDEEDVFLHFQNGFDAQGVHLRSEFTPEFTSHLSLTRSRNLLLLNFEEPSTLTGYTVTETGERVETLREASRYKMEVDVPVYTVREDLGYQFTPTFRLEPGFLFAFSPATSLVESRVPEFVGTEVGQITGTEVEVTQIEGPVPESAVRVTEIDDEFSQLFRRTEGYLQARYEPFPFLSTALGVRVDYLNVTEELSVQPRGSLAFTLPGDSSLRLAYGRYEQSPRPYEMLAEGGNPDLTSSVTSHYIVEIERELSSETELKLAGYYKAQEGLVTPHAESGYLNQGSGYVGGAEVFLRHRVNDQFFGWISYAWTHAERRADPTAEYRPYLFDNMNVVTLVGSYRFSPTFEFGAKWQYSSGTSAVPVSEVFLVQDPVTRGMRQLLPDENLSSEQEAENLLELPTYHRLDIRFSKKWDFGSWQLGGFLEVLNVYNRRNPIRAINPTDGEVSDESQFPILPYIGLTVEF